jgi:hypothetical protein
MLTKEAILAATHLPLEEVHVPEWADADGDDVVYIRGMTGAERDLWEISLEVPAPRTGPAAAIAGLSRTH